MTWDGLTGRLSGGCSAIVKGLPAAMKEDDEEETGDEREEAWKAVFTVAVQLLLVVVVGVVQIKGLQISCSS